MYKMALNNNEINAIAKLFCEYNNYSNANYKKMLIEELKDSSYIIEDNNITRLKKEVLKLLKLYNITEKRMLSIYIDRYTDENINIILKEIVFNIFDSKYIEEIISELNTITLNSDILKEILGKNNYFKRTTSKEEKSKADKINNYIIGNLNSKSNISANEFINKLQEALLKYKDLDIKSFRSRMYLDDILNVIVDIEKALLLLYVRMDEFNYQI